MSEIYLKKERSLSDSKIVVVATCGGWPVARYIGIVNFKNYYVRLYISEYFGRYGATAPKVLPETELYKLLDGVTITVKGG